MTRRGVLTALGASGVVAGTAARKSGGRKPYTDDGIVIQWGDCRTVHVRGSDRKLDELFVHYMVCYTGGGPCPDGHRVDVEPDLPLTIDDRYLPFDPPDYHVVGIEYRSGRRSDFVSVPDAFECSFRSATGAGTPVAPSVVNAHGHSGGLTPESACKTLAPYPARPCGPSRGIR